MDSFDYLFSFYGLLLGIAVANVAIGFADMWRDSEKIGVGYCPPLLGIVVMLGVYALAWYALSQTAWGSHVYAVGNNADAARLISELAREWSEAQSRPRTIWLAHLSAVNNTPALALDAVTGPLNREGCTHLQIAVLARDKPSHVWETSGPPEVSLPGNMGHPEFCIRA